MSEEAYPPPDSEPVREAAEPGTAAESGDGADARALQARVAELEDLWRRALASADNQRKHHAAQIERLRDQERASIARQWLGILDDLERALQHAESDPGTIVDGVRAVHGKALALLASQGFPRRDDIGVQFDPACHQAVGSVPADSAPPGTVVEVVQPAYGDGERQLRPALVVVARGE
jgi:molecular chaperone GrpE